MLKGGFMKFISIREAMQKGSGEVSIRGWVYRERKSNKFGFIVLRDATDIVQCIIEKDKVSEKIWADMEKILIESSCEIHGTIHSEERAPTKFEVAVSDMNVVSFAEPFPINKDQSTEFLLDERHLWIRSRYMTSILKIRSTVFQAIRGYFWGQGFYEHHSPSFTAVQCEGGSTLFEVDYFGHPVNLTQSWQLYAEPVIFSLEKIFTIAPSFRAEKSKTSRHLTEYWHAEMEVAWCDFNGMMNYGEELIKYVVKSVLEKNQAELAILNRDVSKLAPAAEKPFERITYDDALKMLKEKFNLEVPWGKDLRTIEEDKLTSLFDRPVIVTMYPKAIKAFYMKEDPKNPDVVSGSDFLLPEGYGEVIGGSERESELEKIKERLLAQGEKLENYEFYLDTRRYGSVPHSGFGLGVERLISWICGLENIKDAIAFPRTMLRWTP
jgi:asparaginyl-tRNA synthetase